MTRDSMLRHRGRAAADDDAGPARRPLIERDANSATAPRQHSGASKAKQSPMVDRARESQPDLGLSSSSRVSGMKQDVGAISMLKIPTRLAGPQTARMRQGSLAVKRSNPAPPDPSIESPYKRATSVRDVSLPEGGQNAFVPLSLSLGALGAPQAEPSSSVWACSRRGELCVDRQTVVRGSNQIRERTQGQAPAAERSRGAAQFAAWNHRGVAMGLKDIRDVFYGALEASRALPQKSCGTTPPSLTTTAPCPGSGPTPTLKVSPTSHRNHLTRRLRRLQGTQVGAAARSGRALHRAEDPDPWFQVVETAFANAGGNLVQNVETAGMTESTATDCASGLCSRKRVTPAAAPGGQRSVLVAARRPTRWFINGLGTEYGQSPPPFAQRWQHVAHAPGL